MLSTISAEDRQKFLLLRHTQSTWPAVLRDWGEKCMTSAWLAVFWVLSSLPVLYIYIYIWLGDIMVPCRFMWSVCSFITYILQDCFSTSPLQWHHNGCNGISNHQPQDCLLNLLFIFRCRSKKTSKLWVTGLCAGNSPVTGEFPHKQPVTRKMFPFDDIIMPLHCICTCSS